MIRSTLAGVALAIAMATGATAQPAQPPAADHNDYADKANWLCWPGREPDACKVDLTTTVVKADGSMIPEAFTPAANPPVDCFYVYPTVSRDNSVLSDMVPNAEEYAVVKQQAARFAARCRVFAPMYRQFTLTALRAVLAGLPLPDSASAAGARHRPYQDVLDAWNYYLAHENHGRGVVLIGHSQGSAVLGSLLANEIDGKPTQKLLVSAILMGTVLTVPKGADVGGDLKSIPLCRSPGQVGCVIAYASFRDTVPPPDNSRFGRPRSASPGMVAACVNPANLAGGKGELHSYLASGAASLTADTAPTPAWVKDKTVSTPFVSVPGLLTAQCVSNERFNYLSIHVNADPADPRTDDIAGDLVVLGQVFKEWGLHRLDANLAMGNLVDIVGEQSKAWATDHH